MTTNPVDPHDRHDWLRAIHAGLWRMMFPLRHGGRCGWWLGSVHDSPFGAVLYVEHPRGPTMWERHRYGRTPLARPHAFMLEEGDLHDDDWLDGKCRHHGTILLDQHDLLSRVERYRATGDRTAHLISG